MIISKNIMSIPDDILEIEQDLKNRFGDIEWVINSNYSGLIYNPTPGIPGNTPILIYFFETKELKMAQHSKISNIVLSDKEAMNFIKSVTILKNFA